MRFTLPPILALFWNTLRRPRTVFASIVDSTGLPSALLWIILLGLCAGISGTHAALYGKPGLGQDWWRAMPMHRAIAQSVWFCLTDVLWAGLLTWAVTRFARETLRFDALLTVLSLAALPCFLTTSLFPLRNASWAGFHLWQALNLIVVLWSSLLVCLGVQTLLRTSFGKAAQCSLPALLILAALGFKAHYARPTNFRAVVRWEQWEGKHVRVFTVPGKSPKDISLLASGLDDQIEQECALLNESPLAFKIDFFCFDDDAQQRYYAGSPEEPENTAHTFWDCVTLSYDTWDNLHTQMAHEICHVLLANRLTDKVHGLLDEGLCEYVAHAVAPDADALPCIPASPLPLRTLARSDVFFDWEQVQEEGADSEDADWKHYRSAESLVRYLIDRYGMEKFKTLYSRYADHRRDRDPENDDGKQLAHAVMDVYSLSLRELETQWRAACTLSQSKSARSLSR